MCALRPKYAFHNLIHNSVVLRSHKDTLFEIFMMLIEKSGTIFKQYLRILFKSLEYFHKLLCHFDINMQPTISTIFHSQSQCMYVVRV